MQHDQDPNTPERLFAFCPTICNEYDLASRIASCDYCSRFFAQCCEHPPGLGPGSAPVCHHRAVVYVDGACARNGQPGARSGIGCAMDPGAVRTSQRAELLAALQGLEFVLGLKPKYHVGSRAHLSSSDTRREYVIVADSEYVVKGITEWVPQWKACAPSTKLSENHWRTRQGRVPGNGDLFLRLDGAVLSISGTYERQGVKIQFLHVPRDLNSLADALAKEATS
ncbi:ribonuclease H-like domain-containing protein [Mycena filopes]|nr:ribonuclease H-like domain-containing protein [Mycena filopes]